MPSIIKPKLEENAPAAIQVDILIDSIFPFITLGAMIIAQDSDTQRQNIGTSAAMIFFC